MKSKIYLILLLTCVAGRVGLAQNVGINSTATAPRNCAMLDVVSSNTGLLIPTLALTNTGTYLPATGAAVDGLLVYSSSAPTNGNGIGFYYWSTASNLWVNLVDNLSPGSPWYTLGNTSITTPGVPATYGTSTLGAAENYVGTTDANDIVFATNNIERMRIKQTSAFIGIGTAAPAYYFHVIENVASHTLRVENSNTGAFSSVYGKNSALANTGTGNGVYAYTAQSGGNGLFSTNAHIDGVGLFSYCSGAAGAGQGIGVAATTSQTGGCGVTGSYNAVVGSYGWFSRTGVSGISTSAGGGGAGIYGQVTGTANGTGYGITTLNAGVGAQYLGNFQYSFPLAGQTDPAQNTVRTGGAIGISGSNGVWGSLGYRSSGALMYGVYCSAASNAITYAAGKQANGNGTLPNVEVEGIGGGLYGSLMGSWSRGDVLGATNCGMLYASYNLGNAFTSGHAAEIVTLDNKRVAAYPVTSTDIKVYNDGTGKLTGGKTRVNFEQSFTELTGNNKPVVTVTPMGQCNGVYIMNVDARGFEVIELNGGTSNIEFSYIVISKRVDAADKPKLPADLASTDFDAKLKKVMFNESDKENSGMPIWWDGGKLRFDEPKVKAADPLKSKTVVTATKKVVEQ